MTGPLTGLKVVDLTHVTGGGSLLDDGVDKMTPRQQDRYFLQQGRFAGQRQLRKARTCWSARNCSWSAILPKIWC